ncbi:hypothetical protein ACFL35_13215 [Candidatus Riflebacteria bacterium]
MHSAVLNKKQFSLVEIIFSLGIISLLLLVLVYCFRNNLISFKAGNIKIQNQARISLLIKQIYVDFKTLNPAIYFDNNYHLWFQGEQLGDLYPNLVELQDLDGNIKNGYEKVTLNQSSIRKIGIGGKINQNAITYIWKENKLFRKLGKVEKILAEDINKFHINRNPESDKHLKISMEIKLEDTAQKKGLNEQISLSIAMDTDLIYVKEKENL